MVKLRGILAFVIFVCIINSAYCGLLDTIKKYRLLRQIRSPKSFQKFGTTAKMAFEILDKNRDGVVTDEEINMMKEELVKFNLDQTGAIQLYLDGMKTGGPQTCNDIVEKFKKNVGFKMISSFTGTENIPLIPVVIPMNSLVGYVMDKKIRLNPFDIEDIETIKEVSLIFSFTDFEKGSHLQVWFNDELAGTLEGNSQCDGNWMDFPVKIPMNWLKSEDNRVVLSSYEIITDPDTGQKKRVNPELLVMRSRLDIERNNSVVFFRMPSLPDEKNNKYSNKKVNPIKDPGLIQPGAEIRFELLINDHVLLEPQSNVYYLWEYGDPEDSENYGIEEGYFNVGSEPTGVFPKDAEGIFTFKTLKKTYPVTLTLRFKAGFSSVEGTVFEEQEVKITRIFKGVDEQEEKDRELALICLTSDIKFKKNSNFSKAFDIDFIDERVENSWELRIQLPIFDESSSEHVPDKIKDAQKIQDYLDKFRGFKRGTLSYQIQWGEEKITDEWISVNVPSNAVKSDFITDIKKIYEKANYFISNERMASLNSSQNNEWLNVNSIVYEPYTLQVRVRFIAKEWLWDEGIQDFIALESDDFRYLSVKRRIFVKDKTPPFLVLSEGSTRIISNTDLFTGDFLKINAKVDENSLYKAELRLYNDSFEELGNFPMTFEKENDHWKLGSRIKMPAHIAAKPNSNNVSGIWAGVYIEDLMGNVNPWGMIKKEGMIYPIVIPDFPDESEKSNVSVKDNDPPSLKVEIYAGNGISGVYILSEEVTDFPEKGEYGKSIMKIGNDTGIAVSGVNPFGQGEIIFADFKDPIEVSEGERITIKVLADDNVDGNNIRKLKLFLNEMEILSEDKGECTGTAVMRRGGNNIILVHAEDQYNEDGTFCTQKFGIPILVQNIKTRFKTLK